MTLYDATGAKNRDTEGHSSPPMLAFFCRNSSVFTVPEILPECYLGKSPGTSHPNFNEQDTHMIWGKAP